MPDQATRTEIEAAAFRRLLAHLDERKDVQNIELMNLAGFCRNCLAKWYRAAAEERGEALACGEQAFFVTFLDAVDAAADEGFLAALLESLH